MRILLLSVCLFATTCAVAPCGVALSDDLVPLEYQQPELAVDLGVGLWAWPVPCDADGDGDFDLIVSCPDKPYNGVWLFENTTGDTAKDKFPVFAAPRRLSRTVHYVMPSYVDGQMRVLSPGFEYPDFVTKGLDAKQKLDVRQPIHKPSGHAPGLRNPLRHNQWRYVDYDGDGAIDLVAGIEDWSYYGWDDAWNAEGKWTNGPLHGFVYVLRNTGTSEKPTYAEPVLVEADGKPLDTFGCPSPNFADFDGDGDLDLLCGEFLDGFTYFENSGTRDKPRYAAGKQLQAAGGGRLAMDLEMIVPVAFDWDKDGDLDLVVGDEDGRVALIENTGKLNDDRTPRFSAPRYFQQQADLLKCGALATPVGYDWDGDGDTDIISGNTAGYIEWFENLSGPNVARPKWAAPRRLEAGGQTFRVMAGPNGSIQGPAEAKWGYTTLSVADWNGDALPDVVLNSIWGRVEWLENIGTRAQPKLAAAKPIEVEWEGTPPKPAWTWWTAESKQLVTQWRTTPLVYDFTGDGLVDLAVLDPEGYLALFERSKRGDQLVLLPPRRAFLDEAGKPLRLNDGKAGRSGRRKLCVTDWNGDGKFDLLLNSANADVLQQVDSSEGNWTFRRAGSIAERNIEGHDVSPTVVDFDGNGVPDFLGGAEDGHFYFLANPREAKPAARTKTAPTKTASKSAKNTKPNVILILADDMGAHDLGCTGSTFYETPRLDRLAAEGMRFTSAYSACPVCSPTRAALMTGRWPARVGITDYIPGARIGKLLPAPYLHELPHDEVTIAEAMREAGYTTGMFGKWHLGAEGFLPESQGFQFANSGMNGRGFQGVTRADQVTDPALDFLDKHQGEAFFLYLPHNLVHTPLLAKDKLLGKYEVKASKLDVPEGERFRPERDRRDRRVQDHPVYGAMMEDFDAAVGRILDKLEELGIADRTIVIFTSDNGGLSTSEGSPTSNAPLRAGKGWLYEGGVRVPLIVRWPGVTKPGSTCDVPVVSTDYFPTVLEMCGAAQHPEWHRDGVSITPLLKQSGELAARPLCWHYPHYGNQGGVPGGAIREGDWKLIEFFEDDHVELYNLEDDPVERHDLASAQAERTRQLRDKLHAWRAEVGAKMPAVNPNYSGQTEVPGRPNRRKKAG